MELTQFRFSGSRHIYHSLSTYACIRYLRIGISKEGRLKNSSVNRAPVQSGISHRTVVHNLFRRRATNRFLKTSGGQTSATTQLMSDKYMKTFTIMTCAVNHKVIEKWIHSTRPIYITVILTLFQ